MRHESVDIVIPLYNQIEFTLRCLKSLDRESDGPYRLILVDNGSTDGTGDLLGTLADTIVVINERNRGVAGAWNQGISLSRGKWVVFLNNDTVLPKGWLRALVGFCEAENVAIASPSMREGDLNYALDEYAADFVRTMRGRRRMGTAEGPCFIVRRDVFETIGGFDERFYPGSFEDADFFRRAKAAGFRMATTGSSFIHHFRYTTQRSFGAAADHLAPLRRIYCEKWGLSHPDGNWWEKRWKRLRGMWHRKVEYLVARHTVLERWIDGRLIFR